MQIPRGSVAAIAAGLAALMGADAGRADSVTLKTGMVLKGAVDKDNTIVTVVEPVRRVVLKDTKIASIASEALERFETFRVDQPLVVHSGAMPAFAVGVKAGPWDEQGRRTFEFLAQGATPGASRPVRMTQAINELGPKTIRLRGVDGFWRGQLATSQVQRSVVLGLLGHVDRKDQGERLKVGRFLIQAEWYPEALAELDGIARDFPDLVETVRTVQASVHELQARRVLAEIAARRKAQQPRAVRALLTGFPAVEVPTELLAAVRDQLRGDEAQAEADRALAQAVRRAADALPSERRSALRGAIVAMLRDLDEAPDAVRDRFEPFRRADSGATAEARFARALAGWVGGADVATADLVSAEALWRAREALQRYLAGRSDEPERAEALEALRGLRVADPKDGSARALDPGILANLARHMPPPQRDPQEEEPGRLRRLRARADENPEPTEYVAVLPPEYHPRRRYPALVALHGGGGPEAAASWWGEEAARRGYIVIAPEYNLRDQPPDYRYTETEHAAVVLALRDALKRFSIDADRVFLGGVLLGGNMAWDFGLAHPDLFAGVAVVSGLPAKYVWAYKDNARLVPLYLAMGDLAPAEPEVIFPFGIGLVGRNYDVIYVEYFRRGLEPLPEEIPGIFDWMDPRRREPYPKEFTATTARASDDRFFGVVVRAFAPGRALAPDQVDPMGKSLKPATVTRRDRTPANLLDLETNGVAKLDVWFGPPRLNVGERFEIRINGRTAFRGRTDVDLAPFLEDLRLRGDRQQVYWLRYSAEVGRTRR